MLNATVLDKKEIADGLFFLWVKPDGEVPDFLPGQYVALGLPDEKKPGKVLKRAYSIGSSPERKDALEFYIATVIDGELSPRLSELSANDRVFMAPKIVGTFNLKSAPPGSDLIFVATGTGLAPFMSMLRTPLTWENANKITLLHGVRYERDLAYTEQIAGIKKEHEDRFNFFSTVSRPSEWWTGNKGYVQTFFSDGSLALDSSNQHVYLCGNPAMINDVSGLLFNEGFTEHSRKNPGNLHLENYW